MNHPPHSYALAGNDDDTLRDPGFDRSQITSVAAELAGDAESTRVRVVAAGAVSKPSTTLVNVKDSPCARSFAEKRRTLQDIRCRDDVLDVLSM